MTWSGSGTLQQYPGEGNFAYLEDDDATYYSYVGLAEAEKIVNMTVFDATVWSEAITLQKTKALIAATDTIEMFNYYGEKNDEDQPLSFPRDGDTVPMDIKKATVYIAIRILDGGDVEVEAETLFIEQDKIGSVSTTRNNLFQKHKAVGVISYKAWLLLQKYLIPGWDIIVSRS